MISMKRTPHVKPVLWAVASLLALLFAYREVLLSQIPDLQTTIPVRVTRDEIPVPRRPGTQSIRIVGPPLKLLRFEIDFTRNPQPIEWAFLERIDKRADVMVEGFVDGSGNFSVAKVRDRGHPKAGNYLRRVLSSWHFSPYRKGTVRYYFNVPTRLENMKVQIDVSGMEKNFKFIGPTNQLKDGILCYVDGLNTRSIKVFNE